MWKKYRVLIFIIITFAALVYFSPGPVTAPAEKLDIPSGLSIDLIEDNYGQKQVMISISTYTFNDKNRIFSMNVSGAGKTIPATRSARQFQANHKFIAALQKVSIFSEDMSREGIKNTIDILFSNQFMNDMGWMVVCKGKALDVLKQEVDYYPSASDYLEGMIENSKDYKFFSDNYKIMDAYVRIDAEGRNLVLPYVESVDNKLQISGTALFNKDIMVKKLGLPESKIMNMMREKKAKGILEIRKSLSEYASIYGSSKSKASCQKVDSKYNFIINVDFSGDVISNTLFKDLENKPEIIKKLESELEQQTQRECQEFIAKMQNEYKLDCLNLGWVASAKYGRNTGVDWNEIVSKSNIKVNVRVKVKGIGRGIYNGI